jgi:hypothetical protein
MLRLLASGLLQQDGRLGDIICIVNDLSDRWVDALPRYPSAPSECADLIPALDVITTGGALNAVKLAGNFEEVDLGWAVVESAVVGSTFEAMAMSAVSFDHPAICSVPAWRRAFGKVVGCGFGAGPGGGRAG